MGVLAIHGTRARSAEPGFETVRVLGKGGVTVWSGASNARPRGMERRTASHRHGPRIRLGLRTAWSKARGLLVVVARRKVAADPTARGGDRSAVARAASPQRRRRREGAEGIQPVGSARLGRRREEVGLGGPESKQREVEQTFWRAPKTEPS